MRKLWKLLQDKWGLYLKRGRDATEFNIEMEMAIARARYNRETCTCCPVHKGGD